MILTGVFTLKAQENVPDLSVLFYWDLKFVGGWNLLKKYIQ